jgi:PLD-like domain
MPSHVAVTGLAGRNLLVTMREAIVLAQPGAVGVASAFLSRPGAEALVETVMSTNADAVRSVIGISGAVTDPDAIAYLLDWGIPVRLAYKQGAIFHAKVLVGGESFLDTGNLAVPSCGYLGSANFTNGGLVNNIEVGLVTTEVDLCEELADTFELLWNFGVEATDDRIETYRAQFAARQQVRSVEDLSFLEVTEDDDPAPTIPPVYSRAAWAGLESFTGEYALQVEFPRRAGDALAVMLGTSDGRVEIDCVDNIRREMTYRYYADNGMYRLNVPNEVPGVEWARSNHSGALLVSRGDEDIPTVEIISGNRLQEVAERSRALGYCGQTTTREYGWY